MGKEHIEPDFDIIDLLEDDDQEQYEIEEINQEETMDYSNVKAHLVKNPDTTIDDLEKSFPDLEKKELVFFQQQFLVNSGRSTVDDAQEKLQPRALGTGKVNQEPAKKKSINEKVYVFLRMFPDSTNEELYDNFPTERQNSIRSAKGRYQNIILPLIEYLEENPNATEEDIEKAGVVDQPPKKNFRIAKELVNIDPEYNDNEKLEIDIDADEQKTEPEIIKSDEIKRPAAQVKKATKEIQQTDLSELISLQKQTNDKLDRLIDILANPETGTMQTLLKSQILNLLQTMMTGGIKP